MAPTKKTNPFDPQAMLEAQRRNFDAFRNAGQIVADGMRTYAERQVAMMQEAMSGLWSELHSSAHAPTSVAAPKEQLERMRDAFEKVVEQVQELSQLLLRVQSDAIAVLNDCATKNLESLGGVVAPEFVELQKKAKEAVEAASRQTTAVVDEMKKRMASLEEETRQVITKPATPAAEAASESEEASAAEAPARRPRRTTKAKTPTEE